MSKTLNARNAKNNFEKYYKQEIQSSENNLEKYKEFLDIFKQIGKQNTYESLSCWIWVILSKYKEIEYTSLLKGNSANAKFMVMKVLEDGNDTEPYNVFAKFQLIAPQLVSDSMLIDNINGYIINIIPKPHRDSFMKYIDSCRSFLTIEVDNDNVLREKQVHFDLENILNIKDDVCNNLIVKFFNENCAKDKTLITTRVSFHDAVKHEDSLSNYLPKLIDDCLEQAPNKTLIKNFIHAIEVLFSSISYLGNRYGFCHNDAHIGNVLVSKTANKFNLVLIDYGRVLFDETLFDDHMKQLIKSKMEFEHLKDSPFSSMKYETYNQFYKSKGTENLYCIGLTEFLDYNRFSPANGELEIVREMKKRFYLFDIMTIAMNMVSKFSRISYISNFLKTEQKETLLDSLHIFAFAKAHYSVRKNIYTNDLKIKSLNSLTIVKYDILFDTFKELIDTEAFYKMEHDSIGPILLPGVIMFGLLLEYILKLSLLYPTTEFKHHDIKSIEKNDISYHNVNMRTLAEDLDIIHTHFQLKGFYNFLDFVGFYKEHKHIFDYLANFYETYDPSIASQLANLSLQTAGKNRKNLKIRKSLKTKVNKVSKNKFRKYIGSGMEEGRAEKYVDPLTKQEIIYEGSDPVRIEVQNKEKPQTKSPFPSNVITDIDTNDKYFHLMKKLVKNKNNSSILKP